RLAHRPLAHSRHQSLPASPESSRRRHFFRPLVARPFWNRFCSSRQSCRRTLSRLARRAPRSCPSPSLRVTHGSRRATTKDENGPRHLCFVFNAIGSYFHRSRIFLSLFATPPWKRRSERGQQSA